MTPFSAMMQDKDVWKCFVYACGIGNLPLAKQLLNKYKHVVDIPETHRCAFNKAFKNGHLEVVKWLDSQYNVYPNNPTFVSACSDGHFEVVKWSLHKTHYDDDDDSTFKLCVVRNACENGHFELAKLLYMSWHGQFKNDESAFIYACEHNQLHFAKWLLQTRTNIDISANNELAFRKACENYCFNVARWLLEVKPDIDISVIDMDFIYSMSPSYPEFKLWLLKLNNKTVTKVVTKEKSFSSLFKK